MNNKTIGSAIALTLASTVSFNAHAALASYATLQFTSGVNTCIGTDIFPDCPNGRTVTSGSYFSFDYNGNEKLDYDERNAITLLNGIILNTSQPAYGSHTGEPIGIEGPNIDAPFNFFGNTGMHQTTSPVTILSDDGSGHVLLNFSGWNMLWTGVESIPLGGDLARISDTGMATVTCNLDCSHGDTFTLAYTAHVRTGDPSGLGGIRYGLHMEGVINAVPVPTAVWLFGSGLIGLASVAQRRKPA